MISQRSCRVLKKILERPGVITAPCREPTLFAMLGPNPFPCDRKGLNSLCPAPWLFSSLVTWLAINQQHEECYSAFCAITRNFERSKMFPPMELFA